MLSQRWPHGEP